jgi:hypothetical protein
MLSLVNVGAGHVRAGSGSSRSGVVVAAATLRVSRAGEELCCRLLRRFFFGSRAISSSFNGRISSNFSIPINAPCNPSRCSAHNRPCLSAGRAHRVQALVDSCECTNPTHTAMGRTRKLRAEKSCSGLPTVRARVSLRSGWTGRTGRIVRLYFDDYLAIPRRRFLAIGHLRRNPDAMPSDRE